MNPWEQPPFWADTPGKADEYRRQYTGDREEHRAKLKRKTGEELFPRLPSEMRDQLAERFPVVDELYEWCGENKRRLLPYIEGSLKIADPLTSRREGSHVEEVFWHGQLAGM